MNENKENEQEEADDYTVAVQPQGVVVQPQGVPTHLAVMMLTVLTLLIIWNCYTSSSKHPEESGPCAQNAALAKANAENQKAQFEFQTQQIKTVYGLQVKAMEACIAHGGMPQITSGNVSCAK